MRRRSRFFGGGGYRQRRPVQGVAVTQVVNKKRCKCKGCGVNIEPLESAVRLRLKKLYRLPCATCSHKLQGVKKFHPQCAPMDTDDINKAMGFVPSAAPPDPYAGPASGAVPPPPKPPTLEDKKLTAMAALETAIIGIAQSKGINAQMEKDFKTYQGCKARMLNPGTDSEGETAGRMALIQLIKLVF